MNLKRKYIRLLCVYILLIIFGFIIFYICYRMEIKCFFNVMTGLLCPSCGNTRATALMLSGDFYAPIKYNLMYYPEVLTLLAIFLYVPYLIVLKKSISNKFICAMLVMFGVFLIWGIVRNLII